MEVLLEVLCKLACNGWGNHTIWEAVLELQKMIDQERKIEAAS